MRNQSTREAEKLRRWVQIVRKNPDTMKRLEALLEIQKFIDPRIPEFFEWVSEHDKSPQVRDLARNLLTKKQKGITAPLIEPFQKANTTNKLTESTEAEQWTCASCGKVNENAYETCTFCGWSHT